MPISSSQRHSRQSMILLAVVLTVCTVLARILFYFSYTMTANVVYENSVLTTLLANSAQAFLLIAEYVGYAAIVSFAFYFSRLRSLAALGVTLLASIANNALYVLTVSVADGVFNMEFLYSVIVSFLWDIGLSFLVFFIAVIIRTRTTQTDFTVKRLISVKNPMMRALLLSTLPSLLLALGTEIGYTVSFFRQYGQPATNELISMITAYVTILFSAVIGYLVAVVFTVLFGRRKNAETP